MGRQEGRERLIEKTHKATPRPNGSSRRGETEKQKKSAAQPRRDNGPAGQRNLKFPDLAALQSGSDSDMAIVFIKDPPRFVKAWAGYRNKRLGGKTGAASGVRRVNPETGETVETISRNAIKKAQVTKNPKAVSAPRTANLEAAATAILRTNPEKKKRENQPTERSKREIRQEVARLRKIKLPAKPPREIEIVFRKPGARP